MVNLHISGPPLIFDHLHCSNTIRVSKDNRYIASPADADTLLRDYHSISPLQQRNLCCVLGNLSFSRGDVYWEVVAACAEGERCQLDFGVTSKATNAETTSEPEALSWTVSLHNNCGTVTLRMHETATILDTQKLASVRGTVDHLFGFFLDCDNQTLAVKDGCLFHRFLFWNDAVSIIIDKGMCA